MNEYYKASEVAKAIAAGVTALVATVGQALLDRQVDGGEIGTIIAATLVAAGVVFRVPNK
jgi:hypothetical protein